MEKRIVFVRCLLLLLLMGVFGPGLSGAFGAYGVDAEFQTVYPGVYSEAEMKAYEAIRDVLSGGKEVLAEKIEAQANGKNIIPAPNARAVWLNSIAHGHPYPITRPEPTTW